MGEPEEAQSLRVAGATAKTPNSGRVPKSPRGRAAAHWNWEGQTNTSSSGPTQTRPNCPGLTLTMASDVGF